MRFGRCAVLSAASFLLAACGPTESPQAESARLRSSWDQFRTEYQASIAAENRMVGETLAWLQAGAVHSPRTQAVSEARRLRDRWARVYFVPRLMHQELRSAKYSSNRVREVQRRVLEELKSRYFELHDYQRYAQSASESQMYGTPPGRLARELEEFRRRLQARPPAFDGIEKILDALPRMGYNKGP